jgi:hypothetical protein
MSDTLSTPRITSQYLDAFTNKTVRIIGKVTQLRGETATIDAEGIVTAHLNRVRFFPTSTPFPDLPFPPRQPPAVPELFLEGGIKEGLGNGPQGESWDM